LFKIIQTKSNKKIHPKEKEERTEFSSNRFMKKGKFTKDLQ
jgi:hypothetical protein